MNIGDLASNAMFFDTCGVEISWEADRRQLEINVVFGPETLGRTLAQAVALHLGVPYLWVNMGDDERGNKIAIGAKRNDYDRFLKPGVRVLIVDELINNGSTIGPVVEFLRRYEVEIVGMAAIARRQQEVDTEALGVPELIVLLDITEPKSKIVYTPGECELCEQGVPINTDVGYGRLWKERNLNHPSATSRI